MKAIAIIDTRPELQGETIGTVISTYSTIKGTVSPARSRKARHFRAMTAAKKATKATGYWSSSATMHRSRALPSSSACCSGR